LAKQNTKTQNEELESADERTDRECGFPALNQYASQVIIAKHASAKGRVETQSKGGQESSKLDRA